MVYSNINKNASVYAVLLLLSLALISESLPTADLSDKGDNHNSGRWSSPLCGQLSFDGSTGTFHSPNYPANYAHDNLDCRYYIDVRNVGSSRILLGFSDFSTEQSCDFVEIYQGSSISSSPRIAVFSGNGTIPSPILIEYPYILVRFGTDYSVNNYRGFSATWTAV